MIACADLCKIVEHRLGDANLLHQHKRDDGAQYLVGYAVEIALKVRFCRNKGELDFPTTKAEFQNWKTKYGVWLKQHSLQNLADATGWDSSTLWFEWSQITKWDVTMRYSHGFAKPGETSNMIAAAAVIVGAL